MREILSPIVLAGPTTVGKSEVAKHLADLTDGVIVNADKYFLYAGNDFMLGLGLEVGELNDGRQRTLFGALEPHAQLPDQESFKHMINRAIQDIHEQRATAIIEGCSYRFNRALIGAYGLRHSVNITWADRSDIAPSMVKRIDRLVAMGLYNETQRALDRGYETTFPMTSMMYRPAKEVLRGNITENEARNRMVENGLDNALEHDLWYAGIAGLTRFIHDRKRAKHTAEVILSHFST